MKKITTLLLLCLSLSSYATVVVSDLDDTIKITNVADLGRAIPNGLFTTNVFEPMPMLLRAMDQYVNGIYILSASPRILNFNIKKLLNKHQIPYRDLFTRTLADFRDKKEYKLRMIKSVIENEEEVILIGDNVEIDEQIYLEIKRKFPDKKVTIYIHQVSKKEISTNSFYTAFDIAAGEYLNGRMEFTEVAAIAKEVVLEKQMLKIIPKFAYCPTKTSEFRRLPFGKLRVVALGVQTKIISYCRLRQKQ